MAKKYQIFGNLGGSGEISDGLTEVQKDEVSGLIDEAVGEIPAATWESLPDKPFGETKPALIFSNRTMTELPADFNVKTGKLYTVIFDGVTYAVKGGMASTLYSDICDYIGNSRIIDSDLWCSTTYPFVVYTGGRFYNDVPYGTPERGILFADTSIEHTIEIYDGEITLSYMDEKFIPDTIARTSDIPAAPDIYTNTTFSPTWVNNVIDGNGNTPTNSARLLTSDYLPSGAERVVANEGYKFCVVPYNADGITNAPNVYYNPETGDFNNGVLWYSEVDLTTINLGTGWIESESEFTNFKLIAKRDDGADIAPNEGSNIVITGKALDLHDDRFFIADYGVTTYAEVAAAKVAGKTIGVRFKPGTYNSMDFIPMAGETDQAVFFAGALYGGGITHIFLAKETNEWGKTDYTTARQIIGSGSWNTIPTTEAVVNYAQPKGEYVTAEDIPEVTWESLPDKPFEQYEFKAEYVFEGMVDNGTDAQFSLEENTRYYIMVGDIAGNPNYIHGVGHTYEKYPGMEDSNYIEFYFGDNVDIVNGLEWCDQIQPYSGFRLHHVNGSNTTYVRFNNFVTNWLSVWKIIDEPGDRTDLGLFNPTRSLDPKFIPASIARTSEVVKTVNNIAPDENGNVEVSEGVKSWNDLEDRPFEENAIVNPDRYAMYDNSWVSGKALAQFNGNEYVLDVKVLDGEWTVENTNVNSNVRYVGNTSIPINEVYLKSNSGDMLSNYPSDDVPFVIVWCSSGGVCLDINGNRSMNWEIYKAEVNITTLDPKFIPSSIKLPSYTEEDEGKVLRIVNGVPTWVAMKSGEGSEY